MAGERWHEAWTLDAGIDPGPAVLEGPNGRRGLWRGGHSGANWASISRLDQRLRCWPSRLISDAPLTSVGSWLSGPFSPGFPFADPQEATFTGCRMTFPLRGHPRIFSAVITREPFSMYDIAKAALLS